MKIIDSIIFESDDYLAVNKPAGLLSIPDREGKETSLKVLLQEAGHSIFTVHRLDKETSGVIVFAKNDLAHRHLSVQFEERKTVKIYQGLVVGSVPGSPGTIDKPIAESTTTRGMMIIHRRGKESVTDYEVLENFGSFSWLQFRIHTGRTHQIRVHMKDLAHPIACDPLYGDGKPLMLSSIKSKFKLSRHELEERPLLNRLALHSLQLSFTDPAGGSIHIEAPLSKDLRATLQQLEKNRKKQKQ
jgi:23S rRNA pseudouridine955/2504/2580 synthase/23S rRNA pseudouridine1911/1915/1917 synthase